MLKHCVLSVDYSEKWDKIFDHLPGIIKLLGVERLSLTHVVETHNRKRLEDNDSAIAHHLEKIEKRLQTELDVQVDHVVRHGFPAAELAAAARKLNADGIIALNRNHSAGRAALFGNVVLNLTRVSSVPVVVIPADAEQAVADSPLMLATDGSDSSRNAQRAFEKMLSRIDHGFVVWIKADDDDDHDEERVQTVLKHFAETYPKVQSRRIMGDPAEKLVSFAEQEHVALLIIGKRGNTPIAELLVGSTAEAVARASHRPVLLMP
ncbi:universal stress protein [Pseudomonas sp. OIL-1]|uniref:universal stress protein n=1 Tax=Pseudomonas sp. OIL-1 TaxID=2706126 RepID=UPI0013A76E09|nr:universal stress protein [Pseudomonas sp. OIL-1]QIB49882.1 universal stress protein [Pseudomonas sp. OIL-1]